MPRHKGQRKCGDGVAGVAAEALPVCGLKNYLCELGPRFCPICFSKCAFGERYLALRRAGEIPPMKRRVACVRKRSTAPAG